MSMTKTTVGSQLQRSKLFPLAVVSRKPLKVGLEYGMAIKGRPMPAPTVAMPIRSSLAQILNVHRFQVSRNIRLLHGYGFKPGNPVLKADKTPLRSRVRQNTPTPVMTRFGQSPIPGNRVFPRTASPGTMGSPKRFPRALPFVKNTYRPPVYGES